ncbi:putative heme response regulator HssR [Lacticaseibacillus rhamnosus ATCC 21052]|jgi:DNA-binding response OmpR family regulator|uniref:Heme response regulator HssR n=2 Tax=Lactobacillaceae TaxID=33958 RepID=C2JTG7_LACRM|nr:response regulator receiver domain protein [Lacticaseibacillus rhamnosus LMS2-1]EHJ33114.1 putative heme response regulator HssR [Lacticaseibacillus rhamnosus ATCC 21052]
MTNMSGISILFSKQRPIDPQRKTRLTRTKKERLTLVKILVVEDDRNFNDLIATILRQNGYTVQGAENPPAAYDLLQSEQFDLVLSDIMMPQVDGYQFAQELRRTDPSIPILFITARDDIASKEKGFNSGIDDYMVKPINFNELLLRIKALLRRAKITADNLLIVGNLTLNNEAITAQVNHQTVDVTVREFQILYKLLSYPDHAFSRAELINEFWDLASDTSMRAVDVYITKLREKFKAADGFTIKTIHGLGYKAVLTL